MKKKFYRRHVCFKCTDFFILSEENENGDTDAEWKYTYLVLLFFIITIHNITRKTNKIQCAVFLTSTSSIRKGSRKEVHYIIFVWSKTPTLRRYLSIPFNDIRKQSVKLRRTVSVVAKKLHQFFKKVEWFRIKLARFQIIPNPRVNQKFLWV